MNIVSERHRYNRTDDIIVRRARRNDQELIADFLSRAYGARAEFKYPHRWHWAYIDNPYGDGTDLKLWIAIDNGAIIGQTGAMYNPVIIGNRALDAAWSIDTIVLPEYRGKKVGKRLQFESAANHAVFLSLRSSLVNRKIKMQFGSHNIKDVQTLIRWDHIDIDRFKKYVYNRIRFSSYLNDTHARWIRRLKMDHAAARVIMFWLKIRKHLTRRRWPSSQVTLHQIESFDEQIDAFIQELQPHYDFMVVRDSTYLNWRYTHQPHMDYGKFIARKNDKICGFMVLRRTRPPEARLGIIAELCARPTDEETFQRMMRHALQYFGDWAEAVKCATADEVLIEWLKKNQFDAYETDPLLVHTQDDGLRDQLRRDHLRVLVSMGDHDWDQYPMQSLKYKIGWFDLDAWLGRGHRLKRIFTPAH